jgi:hypothetical protein
MGVNLVGRKFGRLIVLNRTERPDIYECRCACGNEVTLFRSQLMYRVKRHCGCLSPPSSFRITAHTRHYVGSAGNPSVLQTPEYQTWRSMMDRCYVEGCTSYPYYGALGVSVCPRWAIKGGKGFQNFLTDMGARPVAMTLDRVNPFLNYFKANCRWATRDIQCWNKRRHWLNGKPPEILADPLYATHVKVAQDLDAPLF